MKIKRLNVIITIFLLEIIALFAVIFKLSSIAGYIYFFSEVLSILAVIYLVLSPQNPSFKISWVTIILVFPMFGVFIYLIFGTHYLLPNIRNLIKKSKKINHSLCCQNTKILNDLKNEEGNSFKNSKFIIKTSNYPVYDGTKTEILLPGEKIFEEMLIELEKAERFIFIEFFIIKYGYMYDKILDVLRRKSKDGIEIKIIYDDIGCIDRLTDKFKTTCKELGIEAYAFNPIIPILNSIMVYRDHRKLVIIDGKVGFTGGFNIGDEYINIEQPYGYWYDGGIKVSGKAVYSMSVMFINMWQLITSKQIDIEKYNFEYVTSNDGYVQPFSDSPLLENVSEGTYMNLINSAQKYVYITTPYLVCDREMTVSLCNAAKSGIDVRIVTPHIPDKPYVFYVTRANYELLLLSGVKIFEYTKGFIHAKMVISDGYEGVIGSINVDYRSFNQQFEDAVMLYKTSSLETMKDEFDKLFDSSQEITLEQFKNRSTKEKILEVFFKLFEPLM